jgi:hypothetical protein
MKKAFTVLFALVMLLANAAPFASRAEPEATEQVQTKEITVYITRTGKKYHRAGCSYLRSSSIPISLKNAKSNGYTACSRCRPPR